MGVALALGLLLCGGVASASDAPTGVALSGVRGDTLSADGARSTFTAERATIGLDGDGLAQEVTAEVVPATADAAPTAAPEDPATLTIEAPRSSWEVSERRAIFEGGVVARRGDLTLTCERLEVRYGEDGAFQSASAEGGVEATRGQWTAAGAAARLEIATGELALTGSPWLRDGKNTLSGTHIVFFLDAERVECVDCRLVVGGAAIPALPGAPIP